MIIGIISYFPDNKETGKLREIRQIRYKRHYDQLTLFKQVYPGVKIVVFAQNYKPHEYMNNLVDKYIISETATSPSIARNKILEYFYNTNEDYCLLCDDDSTLHDYYKTNDLLMELHTNPEKFIPHVDFINGLNPRLTPFKEKLATKLPIIAKNYILEKVVISGLQVMVIKNAAKYNQPTLYFDTHIDAIYESGYEDKAFIIGLVVAGRQCYTCPHMIYKTLNDDSTLFNTFEDRMSKHKNNNECLAQMYTSWGVEYKNNQLKFDKLFHKFNQAQEILIIPREKEVEFNEEQVKFVKRNKKNIISLFKKFDK